MVRHESSICPRCGTEFECKVGSVLQCQCAGVELTDKQREYVASKYEDCLCARCLRELGGEFEAFQDLT